MEMTTSRLLNTARAAMKRPTVFVRGQQGTKPKVHVFAATRSGLLVGLDRTDSANPVAGLSFNDARARHFCQVAVTNITEPPPGRGRIEALTRPFPAQVDFQLPDSMVSGGTTLTLARISPDPDMERLSLSGTLPVETALCPYADRLRYSATLQIEGRAVICDDVFPLTEAGARYFLGTSVLFTADRPTAADLFMVRLADEYLGVGEVEINCLTDGAPQDALFFTLRLAYAALRDELSNLMLGDEGYHGFAAEAGLRALLYGARGNRDWSYTTVLGEISRVVELFERAGLGDVVNREQVDALFTRTLPDDAPRAGEHG